MHNYCEKKSGSTGSISGEGGTLKQFFGGGAVSCKPPEGKGPLETIFVFVCFWEHLRLLFGDVIQLLIDHV